MFPSGGLGPKPKLGLKAWKQQSDGLERFIDTHKHSVRHQNQVKWSLNDKVKAEKMAAIMEFGPCTPFFSGTHKVKYFVISVGILRGRKEFIIILL